MKEININDIINTNLLPVSKEVTKDSRRNMADWTVTEPIKESCELLDDNYVREVEVEGIRIYSN